MHALAAGKTQREIAEELELSCLLYTSDAADERSSVDLGGRRIIKKKNKSDVRYAIIYLAHIYTTAHQPRQ